MSCKLSALLASGICLLICSFVAAEDKASDDEQALRKAGFATDGNALLQEYRKRIPSETDVKKARDHIRRLASEDFAEREESTAALIAMGHSYRALLREAARNPDFEVSQRASDCLEHIARIDDSRLMQAITRTLVRRAPPDAAAVLLAYVGHAEEPALIEEIGSALARLGVKDGKAQPALVTALSDPLSIRRAIAGEALVRGGAMEQRVAVRRLLRDPDMAVRERLAMALLDAHDREAVPALIRLLGELSPIERLRVEDSLIALAGEGVPQVAAGPELAARRVEAWKAWWQQHGANVNLENYDSRNPLGMTLACTMDVRGANFGRVAEYDPSGQVRWQIENLRYPIDAQYLGSGRVLIVEYTGRQVSERNIEGTVLWHYDVVGTLPIGARRQPDGNTIVVTREDVIEVNPEGQEVGRLKIGLNRIAAAVRLPNHQTAVVSLMGEYTLYDATGMVVNNFNLNARVLPIGCNIDILPNGNVLIPLQTGSVVEVDMTGKIVWQVMATMPSAVQRLANGNTLIASRLQSQVSEVDKDGKVVATTPVNGRLFRASRR